MLGWNRSEGGEKKTILPLSTPSEVINPGAQRLGGGCSVFAPGPQGTSSNRSERRHRRQAMDDGPRLTLQAIARDAGRKENETQVRAFALFLYRFPGLFFERKLPFSLFIFSWTAIEQADVRPKLIE